MPTDKKMSREEMIAIFESPDFDLEEAGFVEVDPGPRITAPPPISIRISPPLLEALDRDAKLQHRSRSNLITHILWEYVHAQRKRK